MPDPIPQDPRLPKPKTKSDKSYVTTKKVTKKDSSKKS